MHIRIEKHNFHEDPNVGQHGKTMKTHHSEKFLDLLDGPLHLELGPVLAVLHRDEHVQLVVQVLPVRLTAILFLLPQRGNSQGSEKIRE
jgi:hypothetical protein